ncbi:Calx-beta domain-containing protein [Nocardioides sp.]|uniref:Calx-beta domain-containing protein n=1 Tax=Nocardioides sp. TaxID=35761 RepID=UPI003D0CD7C6
MSTATTRRSARRHLTAAAAGAVAVGLGVAGAPAQAAPVAPTVLLPNIVVAEGDSGPAGFVVNVGLSAPNPFNHAVSLEVVDYTAVQLPGGGTYGTATPGTDYVAFPSFDLVFQPGQQVARFTVAIKGDTAIEPSEEIDVRFDDTEFFVGDNDIDLVIGNDDTGAAKTKKPLLLPPNQTMPEPDSGCFDYRVTVPLSKPAKLRSTVDAEDYSAVPLPPPLTGTYGTASPGSDYVGFGSRTLTYPSGKRVSNLPITICGDTTAEGDEEVDVRFDNTTTIAVTDNDIDLVLANED